MYNPTLYYQRNKEHILARMKKFREDNKELVAARKHQYYIKNSERLIKKAKMWKLSNRDRAAVLFARHHYKQRYGLTLEDIQRMLDEQDSKCKLCGKEFTDSKDTCTDHDHVTGKIRGLLCRYCNVRLRHVEDVEFRNKALAYLKNNG